MDRKAYEIAREKMDESIKKELSRKSEWVLNYSDRDRERAKKLGFNYDIIAYQFLKLKKLMGEPNWFSYAGTDGDNDGGAGWSDPVIKEASWKKIPDRILPFKEVRLDGKPALHMFPYAHLDFLYTTMPIHFL